MDGVTVADYEADLDGNLRRLLERLVGKTYLHYVLDLWVEKVVSKQIKGAKANER